MIFESLEYCYRRYARQDDYILLMKDDVSSSYSHFGEGLNLLLDGVALL